MEVKRGYKQTEVGEFPADWVESRIGTHQPFVTSGSRGWARFYSSHGDLFVRITNMSRDAISLDLTDACFVKLPPSGHEGARTHLAAGDVLVSVTADIGIISYVDDAVPLPAYINQHIALVRFPKDAIDSRFAAYFLARGPGQRTFRTITDQGAKAGINLLTVRAVPIVVPADISEQKAIAIALSDVDALLEGLDRLIAKKRDLKQAAMQQLLTGQKRLPGFRGEWEVKPIKKVVQIPVTDGPHLTPEFLDDGIPFLSVNNLVDNKIDLTELRFISRSDHELFSRKCKPARKDLLLGKAASVGKIAFVDLDMEFNIWSPIALIRLNSQHSPEFFHYCFQSSPIISQITLFTNSSSQGNLGMSDIEKLEFPIPSLAEQTAIAEVLSDMDAELTALEQRRDKTRDLKQGMMQELLTGRIRLV